MAGENGRCTIELLGEYDAGEPMRQSEGAKRQLQIGAGEHLRRQALGAADEKSDAGGAAVAKPADGFGELGAAEKIALTVEAYQFMRGRHLAEHDHGFGGGARGWRGTPRLGDLDHRHRRKPELVAGHLGAAEIMPEQITFGALLQPAHGSNEEPHGATL